MESSFTAIDGYRLWTEADVLCLRADGPVTSAIVDWVAETCDRLLSLYPDYYILGDLLDAGRISPELRRRLVEVARYRPPKAIAFYHVSPVALGVNALLFSALNAFSKRKIPLKQCSSEAEARAWLKSQRASLPSGQAG
ncbi:MAG TPA: STAS/SEC14 domain-containing protein [Pseudomonadota bacterium]|nr:STAS/SEC14 domain-containing protein [Pseudomonadota bacterium]